MRNTRISTKNGNGAAIAAAVFMLLSAAARIAAYRDILPFDWGRDFFYLQVVLPLACNLIFAVMILTVAKKRMWPTVIPVLLGCAFFVARITEPRTGVAVGTWHIALCCCLYTLVGVIYTLTVCGVIRSRLPVILVFALPLIYHIGEAVYKTVAIEGMTLALTFNLPEISVLLIMCSLLTTALALKN